MSEDRGAGTTRGFGLGGTLKNEAEGSESHTDSIVLNSLYLNQTITAVLGIVQQ